MAALDGAVALEQVHDVAVLVAQQLDFDVLRVFDVFLDEHRVVAEGFTCLALGALVFVNQLAFLADDTHAASAAAGRRLQHDGVADLGCDLQRFLLGLDGFFDTGDGRDVDGLRHDLGLDLVAEAVHHVAGRADELDAVRSAHVREVRVLRQEPVPRVDGVDALGLGQLDDLFHIQIRADRGLALADQVRFVRLDAEERFLILLGIDRNGADPELFAGAEDTDGDLTAVCYQDALESLNVCHDILLLLL